MKRIILFPMICLFAVLLSSCHNELRIGEQQQNFNNQYFSYSRYQLTTAIVNTAVPYGKGVVLQEQAQADWYSINCYSGDNFPTFFKVRTPNWSLNDGSNPYTGIFRTCIALETLAASEGNNSTIAVSQILRAVNLAYLTEKYGDVPYSKADLGRTGNIFPTYDSQKLVYTELFNLLGSAVKTLSSPGASALPATQDVLYSGNAAQWIKFANSLKFRLIMHSYNAFKNSGVDYADTLKAIVASGNYMQSNADNASLPFVGTNGSDSWYTNTATWGSINSFTELKPTNSMVQKLLALNDPRLYVWFAPAQMPISASPTTTQESVTINGFNYSITHDPSNNPLFGNRPVNSFDDNGNPIVVPYPLDARWIGAPTIFEINVIYDGTFTAAGNNDNRRVTGLSNLFQKPGKDSRLKAVMMESSEMQFLLAEARAKGLITSGTASGYYNAGITLSFDRWQIADGITPASYDGSSSINHSYSDYLSNPAVTLAGDATDLSKIYFQKWLANFLTNHTEEYTEIRRTGNPTFAQIISIAFAGDSYPYRNLYPFDELNNNNANNTAALAGIGGTDAGGAKMWIFK